MVKLWTFQRKEIVRKLLNGEPLYPDFDSQKQFTGDSKAAYQYLAEQAGAKGLVFGFLGSSSMPVINTIDDLYALLDSCQNPSGTSFPAETHDLLELDVPVDSCMKVDFYRFSDLLFYLGDEQSVEKALIQGPWDEPGYHEDLQQMLLDLFKPNGPNGLWELTCGHIDRIMPEWVTHVYCPK